jgi:hypothetical protein
MRRDEYPRNRRIRPEDAESFPAECLHSSRAMPLSKAVPPSDRIRAVNEDPTSPIPCPRRLRLDRCGCLPECAAISWGSQTITELAIRRTPAAPSLLSAPERLSGDNHTSSARRRTVRLDDVVEQMPMWSSLLLTSDTRRSTIGTKPATTPSCGFTGPLSDAMSLAFQTRGSQLRTEAAE